jgi:hypothetical protein
MSERQFRRYRDRFEDEGELGLIDRRSGKVSRCSIATVGPLNVTGNTEALVECRRDKVEIPSLRSR